MTYQELVSRVLAVKHAGLEMGLTRAREQQPFIEQVARKIDGMSWGYSVRMNRDFGVTFNIELGFVDFKHQYQAVRQGLEELFDVEAAANGLNVECRRSGYTCRVIFGDVPQ